MIDLTKEKINLEEHLKKIKEKNFKLIKKICEICENKNFEIFQSVGRIGKPLEYGILKTVICKSCGHKFINPRYSEEFYKKYYKSKYRKIAFGDLKPSLDYQKFQIKRGAGVFKFLKKYATKQDVILDHGCASGLTMIPWKKNGYNISGIDPHEPSVRLGKKKYKLKIKRAFGEKLPFTKDSLDLVISLGSLEHSYDLHKSMIELSRTLKKNGYLFIRWRSDKLIGSPLEYYNHNHYRFFYKTTWKLLLRKYGFDNIVHLNKNLEGYESYSYIIARNKKIIKLTVPKNDNYKLQIYKQNLYNNRYYKNCLNIEKMFVKKKKKAYKDKIKYLKKNKIHLLNIGKLKSVNRYFSECMSFLYFLRKYKYTNDNR